MAVLVFNEKQLHVQVIAGVLENYKPNKDIKKVYKRIEKLKNETEGFIRTNWQEKSQVEIINIFKQDKEEKKKWDDFMQIKYIPELNDIKTQVELINGKLCPNFNEVKEE